MRADLNTIEKAMLTVFQHLRDRGIDSLELEKDFYWNIAAEQRFDPYREPDDFSLGQLSDDWTEIEKIAAGQQEPLGYCLVWMAALIRYIGEREPS